MSHVFRVLIVDDEQDFAKGIKRLLESHFHDLEANIASSGPQALTLLENATFQLMLTDLRMPEMDGLDLLRRALESNPLMSAIMLTAFGAIDTAVDALKAGAYDFLTKPVDPDHLYRVVAKGLERSRLLEENHRLKQQVATRRAVLIGESPAMKCLAETIEAVARTDYTVLIRGESGTGKELTAKLVHSASFRADGPFITVNCPAIPEELLESELFGHVKGAFTGAERERKGLFASADHGVLLLDEIGDISQAMQLKLLRVLQEGEIRPVGSSRTRPVDVRVLASTNQDLEAKVENKTFREDLYYRLNVLSLHTPPLRERREDIPLLANFFLHKACAEMRIREKVIQSEVLTFLTKRDWPGNVRELQNFMRRLAVFCAGETVTTTCLRMADRGQLGPQDHIAEQDDDTTAITPYKDAKARVVDEFTTRYVRVLLQKTGGNVSEAARQSGLSRVALQKILSRLSINSHKFKSGEGAA
ncbi:sigma-54-dependent transcriptional regulator [Desulfovibrio inopinatus]|uniref:sigma-54-dependent transcriptional regulator n=1 Tax=Desulfovibrio inopinatus TaxID=102109 RepID=UPI00040AAFC1|nr:sigma-54 dependent transcriptional regulator [Desulfovibrio inopinatus]